MGAICHTAQDIFFGGGEERRWVKHPVQIERQLDGLIRGRKWKGNERRRGREKRGKIHSVSFSQPAVCSALKNQREMQGRGGVRGGGGGGKTEKNGDLEIRRKAFEINREGNRMRGKTA